MSVSSPDLLIETHELSLRFGATPVLHNVSLAVPAASIYGFLGPNGAGKSTTLRALLGLLPTPAGAVRLFGQDLARAREAVLARVGALIEMPSLYDHLSGHANLEVTRRLRGLPASRTGAVLELVGLEAADARRPVHQYSLGMRQRLGIALALLPDPELLILDEPTNGLDPNGIIDMRELLLRLQREHGITILISSHLLSEIERIATHVGVIRSGRLLFQGSLAELQTRQVDQAYIVIETQDAAACQRLLPAELGEGRVTAAGTLCLPFRSPEWVAALVRQLVAAGQPLYQVACHRPSLEDTFLHLTASASS